MDFPHRRDNTSNSNYTSQPGSTEPNLRQRRPDAEGDEFDHTNAGLYKELERLRNLVDVIEGESGSGGRGGSSRGGIGSTSTCFPLTLDNSVMSTVFGLVFVTIITVTIYAFHNLFRAISKRFFEEHEPI